MISYQEALKIIAEHTQQLPTESMRSEHALSRVLAEAITSPINLPSFDNSAMDGFALATQGLETPAG